MTPGDLEVVVGLEVHLQLATRHKLFCPCENRFGAEANTLVCPVCLGLPGALPRLRGEAVGMGVRLAAALGCEVAERSGWARKSYFYPDLAKGYQITQYDEPLARGGSLPVAGSTGDARVRLRRLHLEEDAGRLVHAVAGDGDGEPASGVDFNRGGVPLIELVTEPEVPGAEAAEELLRGLRALVRCLGVSDGRMEEGSLRCDANVSLHRPGAPLAAKVEVKNLNSFRAVGRAVAAEARRQAEVLERGGTVRGETRGFDGQATFPMRDKEGEADYRYLTEPDLPSLVLAEVLGEGAVERARAGLPELPWERRERYRRGGGPGLDGPDLEAGLGLDDDTARLLAAEPELADWFEAALAAYLERAGEDGPAGGAADGAAAVAPWVRTEVLGELNRRGDEVAHAPPPEHLGRLVAEVDAGRVSQRAGKRVLEAIWDSGETPEAAVDRLGLAQVSDRRRVAGWVEAALAAEPGLVARYRDGDRRLLGHFIGRVMALSGGSADPHATRRALAAALDADGGAGPAVERADGDGEAP